MLCLLSCDIKLLRLTFNPHLSFVFSQRCYTFLCTVIWGGNAENEVIVTLAFISALKRCLLCSSHTLFDTRRINNVPIPRWSMEVYHLMPVFSLQIFPETIKLSRFIICVGETKN